MPRQDAARFAEVLKFIGAPSSERRQFIQSCAEVKAEVLNAWLLANFGPLIAEYSYQR
jgi:hypothetical protein